MPSMEEIEVLLKDVVARLQSTPLALTEDAIKGIVEGSIKTYMESEAGSGFRSKMRFGKEADAPLLGSKFARHNLSLADIEFGYDLLNGAKKNGMSVGPSEELTNAFNAISKAAYVSDDEIRKMDRQALEGQFARVPKAYHKQLEAQLKAMDSAESGFGSQLVGASYIGNLWDEARTASRVFGLLDSFEMQDATAYIPVAADIPEMLLLSESTANNSSNFTTTKTGSNRVTVTAKKFGVHQMWSGEMEEDSIIPFLPFLRQQLALALAHYTDSAVLNGDTTNAGTGNINLDDADPADTKHYLAFDGLRHAGLVDNTGNSKDAAGAITAALLHAAKGRMLDTTYLQAWGHPTNAADLVYLCDVLTGDKIAMLDEVLTADKFGAKATIFNGQLGSIFGHPVVSSMAMSLTEADGKVSTTAANNVKGQVVAFNRRGFKAGWRRQVKIETERLPASDQTRIVATLRMGFGRYTPTGAASGIEAADVLYNISL